VVNSIAIQTDGKILIAGAKGNMAIARYLANGDVDSTFGTNGIVHSNYLPAQYSYAFGLFILPGGNITAAGSLLTSNQLLSQFMAMQVDSNGLINSQYGNNGTAVDSTPGDYINTPSAATVQADGKVIVAGSIAIDSADYKRFGMVRFNANGTVDQTFGASGVEVATQSGKAYCDAVAIQSGSKILLAGGVSFGTDSFTMTVARFYPGVISGIEDIKLNSQPIVLYPNPAQNHVIIQAANAGDYSLDIYNMLGEIVAVQKVGLVRDQNLTVDISALANGLYQIALTGPEGDQYGSFVKQ